MGQAGPTVAERYASRADFLGRYTEALDNLIKQRWILPEDRGVLVALAAQEWEYATK